jgi:succinate dehydrogenase hydrophobic anchor subunit
MAEHYISTRAGQVQWIMQRVSAMLLLVFAGLHFGLQHFTSDAVSTGLTVAARLDNPYWQAFYIAFIVLVMYHGTNGAIGIVRDYNPPRRWRIGAELALWTLAAAFAVLGLRNVVSPMPLGTVKESYAARGFPAGASVGNPPSVAISYDFRDELRELSLLEYYLDEHVARSETAPLAEVFAHRPGVRLRELDPAESQGLVAASGAAFDAWVRSAIAAGPIDPALRPRLRMFSSSYEFAVWAAHVRLANARLRGDPAVGARYQTTSDFRLPDYRATALH